MLTMSNCSHCTTTVPAELVSVLVSPSTHSVPSLKYHPGFGMRAMFSASELKVLLARGTSGTSV